jgi:hypothetical protein
MIKEKDGPVIDVGEVRMHRLAAAELLPLKGKVTLEGKSDARPVTASIAAASLITNTPHNGSDPRPKWPAPLLLHPDESGNFNAPGLSPSTYYCTLSAPGFVSRGFYIEFHPTVGGELGNLTLEVERHFSLDYIVSTSRSFDLKKIEKADLVSGARWKSTPDIYGWDLEFAQDKGKIILKYAYAPITIRDLGIAELKDCLNADPASAVDDPRDMQVQDGHIYLLNHGMWKHHVLFKVSLPEKATPGR